MMFKALVTLFVTTSLTFVNAAPNPGNNELGARFSPAHNFGDMLKVRHANHHVKKDTMVKRGRRVRRSCPARNSTSSPADNGVAATPTDTPVDTPVNTPTDTPSPPADTPASADTQPTSSADSAPSNDNSSTSNVSGAAQDYLNMHNTERSKHGAAALTWADDLASAAQTWANNCVWKHSGGAVGAFGENLSTGTGMDANGAVQLWLNEAPDYDASNPQYSHWTQVVWKGSQELGCAVATCSGQAMFGTDAYGDAQFHVCEYRPAGNVIGQFAQNVQA